jgi:hypothetical protein
MDRIPWTSSPLPDIAPPGRSDLTQAEPDESEDQLSQADTCVPSEKLEARGLWGKEGQEG